MYSVILAAMLTGGGQQTQAWHRTSCVGSSCVGASCVGSGHGWGHGACYGGGLFHGGHGRGVSYNSYGCNGFTGYTVGYSYWASGCYGSSCFGGCYGTAGIGCFGWTGGYGDTGVTTVPTFAQSEYFPSAPSGSYAPPSSNPPAPNPVVPPAAPAGDKAPPIPDKAPPLPKLPPIPAVPDVKIPDIKIPDVKPATDTNNNAIDPTRARVVVQLPVDAKMWVDKVNCPLPGDTRSFDTPTLLPGANYAYTISVETPDGAREERRVVMAAGRTVVVDFRGMGVTSVKR